MTKLREKNTTENTFQVDAFTEAQTRRKYIDIELMDAGWRIGTDCREEVTISGMPTPTETGRADYVLFGDNGLPLAVIEAKKTGTDPIAGSRQAKLYADCLEKEYHQRPFIFTTNGFEIEFTDDYGQYPRRRVSGFFTKKELQLNMDRRRSRKPLDTIEINDQITNRPYQKEAVAAVCDAIRKKHRRMLIVQATGSGKTRVSISLVDVLRRHNYVKYPVSGRSESPGTAGEKKLRKSAAGSDAVQPAGQQRRPGTEPDDIFHLPHHDECH